MSQQPEQLGMNHIGIQMSPYDSRAMQDFDGVPEARLDDIGVADLRSEYINEADGLGSVPLPVSGAVQTGVPILMDDSRKMLLDKLGQRLAFERTGIRLYDALITKCEAMLDGSLSMTIEDLREIRDEEARHFFTVVRAIESLGGDPTSQTPSANMVGVESLGLVQVLADPRSTVEQSLHAVLTAELSDQAGWESLIALAEEQGKPNMVIDFSTALDAERGHLLMVQSWYEEAIGISSTGENDVNDELE